MGESENTPKEVGTLKGGVPNDGWNQPDGEKGTSSLGNELRGAKVWR